MLLIVVGTKLCCYFRLAVVGVVRCFSCRVLFAAGLRFVSLKCVVCSACYCSCCSRCCRGCCFFVGLSVVLGALLCL